MRKLLQTYAFAPERLVTNVLGSSRAAACDVALEGRRERGRWKNDRAESSGSVDPATGAQDEALQKRGFSQEVPFDPYRRPRHLQCPTPPHVSPNTSHASRGGDDHMARACRSSLKFNGVEKLRASSWRRDSALGKARPKVACQAEGKLGSMTQDQRPAARCGVLRRRFHRHVEMRPARVAPRR